DNPAEDASGNCAAADLEDALLCISGHPETEGLTRDRIAFSTHRELVETKGYLRSTRDATRGVDMRHVAVDDGAGWNDGPTAHGNGFCEFQRHLVSNVILVGRDARL